MVAITWACRLTVAAYAAAGRSVAAPRPDCGSCGQAMTFDGSYSRWIREAGTLRRIFVRRVRCRRCGTGDALLPHFVLGHRLDTATAVGAAVLAGAGRPVPGAAALYDAVPERTVRSWRHRFAARAEELAGRFRAMRAEWAASPLSYEPAEPDPVDAALSSIGALWQAAHRARFDVPGAWPLANMVVGSQLLSTRVDLPWPIMTSHVGRSRSP